DRERRRRAMTALFAMLLVAQATPAQTAATAPAAGAPRETPPEAGPPKDFRLPAAHKLTLDNGLAVTFVQYGSTPKAMVALEVRAGNVDEAPNQVWLADLTGDMLVEGTRTRSAAQIAEQSANLGGSSD